MDAIMGRVEIGYIFIKVGVIYVLEFAYSGSKMSVCGEEAG